MRLKHKIIGVDAGLCNMGAVVMLLPSQKIVQTYLWSTAKVKRRYVAQSNQARIEYLSDRLGAAIMEHCPKYIVAELPTGASMSQTAAVAMSLSFSVVVLTCRRLNVPLHTVTPYELKQHVKPGAKKVSKQDVISFAEKSLSLKEFGGQKEHVADAFACIQTHLAKTYGNGTL